MYWGRIPLMGWGNKEGLFSLSNAFETVRATKMAI